MSAKNLRVNAAWPSIVYPVTFLPRPSPSSPDSMLSASHCCPSLRVQRRGRREAKRKGTEALMDDESGRRQKPDGFLSWLSSRCSLQQTPAAMQPGEETRRQLCGNADPDCSYQLCSSQNRSTIHKKTLPESFQTITHTHTRHTAIIVWWLLELVLYP